MDLDVIRSDLVLTTCTSHESPKTNKNLNHRLFNPLNLLCSANFTVRDFIARLIKDLVSLLLDRLSIYEDRLDRFHTAEIFTHTITLVEFIKHSKQIGQGTRPHQTAYGRMG
ncbi:hypothetical protein CDAR_563371 [Caerostris darwini]|uniref:Uncharacterized protein n=1 Tax=Caerostris darwini TaxID=1538125 RepID=A0AAV4X6T1_9ARAC|nr:hypothetical protein CDAR_563371 [Caerostris darwini]